MPSQRKKTTRSKTAKSKPKTKAKSKVHVEPEPEVEAVVEESPTVEAEVKSAASARKSSRRTWKLVNFDGGPKGGGTYSGTPQQAARKAANRWVCPKDEYDVEHTFQMRESTRGSDKRVVEFVSKRVQLENPKVYKRGDTTIQVDSKIVMV